MKLAILAAAVFVLGIAVGMILAAGSPGGPVLAGPKCPGPSARCTPTPTATATSTPAPTPTATATSTPAPTPTATPTATPVPAQRREDQITIFAVADARQLPAGTTWQTLDSSLGGTVTFISLDVSDYPQNSLFMFEAVLGADLTTACLRLFDLTDSAAVPGSELCLANGSRLQLSRRLRSGGLPLSSGDHVYTVQGRADTSGAGWTSAARIIAEWTE